ncbi:hypothetical protein [Nitrosomonas communis]|uniref:Uncharacterized protein n=1 Tax=Nitrosomonas communis TaxID=44574 RepID=A0A1I4U8Q1_9PROT|nr:hypothetical protein [Nitrosomonas communis]SFM85396.1 hypothetical protein SAMN05421863_106115 [Nitrosomonas communis]
MTQKILECRKINAFFHMNKSTEKQMECQALSQMIKNSKNFRSNVNSVIGPTASLGTSAITGRPKFAALSNQLA